MIRAHVWVYGDVQGVFFRVAAHEEATLRGLTGWVRNLLDGRVEAVFEGPDQEIEEMIAWCREGTPLASVERVEVSQEEPEGLTSFQILP